MTHRNHHDYRRLGPTGCKVSALCLGTMTFGEADEGSMMHGVGCSEETAFAIMNRALDAGVNFFDTADVYGQDGLSERVLGRYFARHGRRNEVVLATKFRFAMGQGPNARGASRYRIMRCAEASLTRLGTDRIDLYQVHMQDSDTPEDETLRALDDLVSQGKVVYAGVSNYAAYRMALAQAHADQHHLARYVSLQAQYSLVSRELEREHTSACRELGLGILAWSPLAGGFLSGKYRKGEAPPAGTRLEKWSDRLKRFDSERNWRILAAVDSIAKERGATPSAVSLAWVLGKPGVTSAIFGARSLEQLAANLAAANLVLSDDEMKKLDEASAFELGYPYEFIRNIQGRW